MPVFIALKTMSTRIFEEKQAKAEASLPAEDISL